MLAKLPVTLPVEHLSCSSVNLYLKCPLRWKRKYIDGKTESISPAALLGGAVGAAEKDSYQRQIEGGASFTTSEVLDTFSDAFELRRAKEGDNVRWEDEKPAKVKDSGAQILEVYHRIVAPTVKPIAVERGFAIVIEGVEWVITGYMDLECEDEIPDLKVRSPGKGVITAEEALAELQPGTYLAARRAEGDPAKGGFVYHNLLRGDDPSPRNVVVTPTLRTNDQLDDVLDLYMRVAAEIAWRTEYDVWAGAARGAWWCSKKWCDFWSHCEFGGRGAIEDVPPRPARDPSRSYMREAITATVRKDGTTTAARVAHYLGISDAAARSRLGAMVLAGEIESQPQTKASGRGNARVVTVLRSQPRVYSLPVVEGRAA